MTARPSAVLLGIAVMMLATPTRAQLPAGPHFTFTVPVRLVNLPPEIQQYSVVCSVAAVPPGATWARGVDLGGGIARGGIEGTPLVSLTADLVVNVTANPLADPALATMYSCSLSLFGVAPPGSPPGRSITYLEFGNVRFPRAPGAVFRQTTTGSIPR